MSQRILTRPVQLLTPRIIHQRTISIFPQKFQFDKSATSFRQTRTMSDIKQISSQRAAQPVAHYSQAIEAAGQIWVSGQIPADAQGNLVGGSIADQTKACCEALKNILEDAGSNINRTVKINVFITTMDHFAEMNSVYEKYFTHKPARSCVAVKELPKGVPVEIEAIALAGRG